MASRGADRLVPYIYWEKQEPGSMLCAQHALNNLMQSPIWTADDLATIARKLDDMEDATFDEELKAKRRGRSANYDDSGFFSLQVLDSALQALGLCLVRWRSSIMKPFHPYPENQSGFILNHHLHWLTLRRFGDRADGWYNLDSTLGMASPAEDGFSSFGNAGQAARTRASTKEGPQWIGPAFLGMTIEQAEREGYSVFCVRPIASSSSSSSAAASSSSASSSSSAAVGQSEVEPDLYTKGGFLHACEADDMALEFSTFGPGPSHRPAGNGKRRPDDDDDGVGTAGPSRQRQRLSDEEGEEGERKNRELSEDEQLRRAIEASLLDDRPSRPSHPTTQAPAKANGSKDAPLSIDSSPEVVRSSQAVIHEVDEDDQDDGFDYGDDFGFSAPVTQPATTTSSASRRTVGHSEEDAELEAAIRASLQDGARVDTPVPPSESGKGEEEWDEPTPEELRKRRLARFG